MHACMLMQSNCTNTRQRSEGSEGNKVKREAQIKGLCDGDTVHKNRGVVITR